MAGAAQTPHSLVERVRKSALQLPVIEVHIKYLREMHNFGLKTEVFDLKINTMSEYQIRKKHGGLDLEIAGILEATVLT